LRVHDPDANADADHADADLDDAHADPHHADTDADADAPHAAAAPAGACSHPRRQHLPGDRLRIAPNEEARAAKLCGPLHGPMPVSLTLLTHSVSPWGL
jgi:hypothetical protein